MSHKLPTKTEYFSQIGNALSGPTREEAHALSKQKPYNNEKRLKSDIAKINKSSRRNFLTAAAAAAGGALAAATVGSKTAKAEKLTVPEWSQSMGRPLDAKVYGMPSKFEKHVTRNRTDVLVNKQNYSDWSMTPLQHQQGIITPNGLIYERHHAGIADIDPDKHRLLVHGMVRNPMVYTMDGITRYPSQSNFHFMECSGNGLTDWLTPKATTVQQTHGLLSCSQWTGIPVSWVLDEAGIDPKAKWVLFEGADGSAHARSIPIDMAMSGAMLIYGSGGEMLRPENGYPLRLFIPGWEGNVDVKWLRRIKVSDKPWHLRSETARYTDPMPDGKWRQFSMTMECKSVITNPSGGMQLKGPGNYEIKGFAWSGSGTVKAVDITLDNGKTWRTADLKGPVMDKCLTQFSYRWKWDGGPAEIASRAVDNTGYVQPTVADLQKPRLISGFVQHHNGIFPWAVSEKGEVTNGIG
jgi:sulfane dehydrogenase subunit SoxC